MKALTLLVATAGLGVVLLRLGQRSLARVVAQDAPDAPAPTFGDRFRSLDLRTAGTVPATDDHEDLLTPPRP